MKIVFANANASAVVRQRVRHIALVSLVGIAVASCAPADAGEATRSPAASTAAPVSTSAPSATPTPAPSPSPTPDVLALFHGEDAQTVTFEGIGPVVLGASLDEVGPDLDFPECGSVEGLPDNVRVELDPTGAVVRLNVYAPEGFIDMHELTGIQTQAGVRFGDHVDAALSAIGDAAAVEETEYPAHTGEPITVFEVKVRGSVDGVDRVMTVILGEQEEGEPRPELEVQAIQVALAGHEGPPWHCA